MSISRLLIGGVAVSVLIGGAAALKRPSSDSVAAQSLRASPNPATPPLPSPVPSPSPIVVPSITPGYTQKYSVRKIARCGGHLMNANFREVPRLSPTAILGVVAAGDNVYLTGRTIQGDGLIWYRAIAPKLHPSPEPKAQNQIDAHQIGWIAGCFVED